MSPDIHTQIRKALLDKGLTGTQAAELLGMHYSWFRNVINGWTSNKAAREKIEDFLGQTFWSDPGEFAARQQNRTPMLATK